MDSIDWTLPGDVPHPAGHPRPRRLQGAAVNTRQRRLRTLTLDAASLGMDFEDLHAALVLAVALAKVLRGVEAKGAELLARRLETMAKLCNEAAEALRVEQEQGETG